MNQVKLSFVLGCSLLGAVVSALGGCSDDDGADVVPKDPTAQAGSGGAGGSGASGGGAGSGGAGAGGGSAGVAGSTADAGLERPACPPAPEPVDAGTEDAGLDDAGGSALDDAGLDAGDIADRELSFTTDIHPIFRMYCRPCHEDEFSGGHNVAADDPREAYGFLKDMAASIVPRVNGGGMPPECIGQPGDPGCITVAELQLIQTWEAQCYPP